MSTVCPLLTCPGPQGYSQGRIRGAGALASGDGCFLVQGILEQYRCVSKACLGESNMY